MREVTFPVHPVVIRGSDSDAQSLRQPKPQPFGAPVIITDVATPLAGEKVLSLLMTRMMSEDEV